MSDPVEGKGHNAKYGRTVTIWLHRFIMDAKAGQQVDHRFGNTLDCRKSQLRIATNGQNQANRKKSLGKSSQYKGVYWDQEREKWYAKVTKDKHTVFLGRFDNEVDAADVYNQAATSLFGEFALLNRI